MVTRPHASLRLHGEFLITVGVLGAGIADATTTLVGLARGEHELNPSAAWLFSHLGVVPALMLRVALPALGVLHLLRWARRDRVIYVAGIVSIAVVVAVWCAAATSNALRLA